MSCNDLLLCDIIELGITTINLFGDIAGDPSLALSGGGSHCCVSRKIGCGNRLNLYNIVYLVIMSFYINYILLNLK